MGVLKRAKEKLKEMWKRRDTLVLLISLMFFIFRVWSGVKGAGNTRPAPPPRPIFPVSAYVNDVFSGSLTYRNILLYSSEVSFVFYYAPWCRASMAAANQFAQVANVMHAEVSFIAVNCWWKRGECRNSLNKLEFPQMHLFHLGQTQPISYNGPHLLMHYHDFLKQALTPVIYLGTSESVDVFLNSCQLSVIGKFSVSSNIMLRKFTEVALTSLKYYPALVRFGLVVSNRLARDFRLKHNHLALYDRSVTVMYPVQQLHVKRNTTADEIIKWAYSRPWALHKIFSSDEKSNALYKVLKKGPTLIVFCTSLEQINLIENIAVNYRTNEPNGTCCFSFPSKQNYSVCLKNTLVDSSSKDCKLAYALMKNFMYRIVPSLSPITESCVQSLPLYDHHGSHIEMCPYKNTPKPLREEPLPPVNPVAIDSLYFNTNRTLNMLALDLNLTHGIARTLGFSADSFVSPFTVIVDLQKEDKYIMQVPYTVPNLESWILNYTCCDLIPSRLTSMVSSISPHEDAEQLVIPRIAADSFENVILHNDKDTLVYYHSSWCAGCSLYSHTLMSLKVKLKNIANLTLYQVSEETNELLPYAFKALDYPTLLLFPGNRTSDSVVFSRAVRCSLPNLLGFLLRHASPTTKAQLLLSTCNSSIAADANRVFFPVEICRKKELFKRMKSAIFTLKRLREVRRRISLWLARDKKRRSRKCKHWTNDVTLTNQKLKEMRRIKTKLQEKLGELSSVVSAIHSVLR